MTIMRGTEIGYYDIGQYAPEELGVLQALAQPQLGYWDIGAGIAPPYHPTSHNPYFTQGINPALAARGYGGSSPMVSMQRPQRLPTPQLRERVPATDRVLWLGFKFAGILTGAAQAVSSQPQDTFSPRKVVIPGSVAPNFEISDLKIGALSQFSSSDPIPAEAFIPNAALTDVHFDTAQVSQLVTFQVTNISNATATFRAAMNGFVVRA